MNRTIQMNLKTARVGKFLKFCGIERRTFILFIISILLHLRLPLLEHFRQEFRILVVGNTSSELLIQIHYQFGVGFDFSIMRNDFLIQILHCTDHIGVLSFTVFHLID